MNLFSSNGNRSVPNSEISLHFIERGSVRFVCNAATCFLRGKLNLINLVLWKLQCVRHGQGEGDMSEREMDHLLVLCGFY